MKPKSQVNIVAPSYHSVHTSKVSGLWNIVCFSDEGQFSKSLDFISFQLLKMKMFVVFSKFIFFSLIQLCCFCSLHIKFGRLIQPCSFSCFTGLPCNSLSTIYKNVINKMQCIKITVDIFQTKVQRRVFHLLGDNEMCQKSQSVCF